MTFENGWRCWWYEYWIQGALISNLHCRRTILHLRPPVVEQTAFSVLHQNFNPFLQLLTFWQIIACSRFSDMKNMVQKLLTDLKNRQSYQIMFSLYPKGSSTTFTRNMVHVQFETLFAHAGNSLTSRRRKILPHISKKILLEGGKFFHVTGRCPFTSIWWKISSPNHRGEIQPFTLERNFHLWGEKLPSKYKMDNSTSQK